MRANYAIRISTVKQLVVIVCLLCAKELSFGNPSDTQRKHAGHCPHRVASQAATMLCHSQAQGDTNGAEGTCQTNGFVC
ncbi:hypothetical protein V8C86DRAFT_2894707, partial [Haematococcus lacustris]